MNCVIVKYVGLRRLIGTPSVAVKGTKASVNVELFAQARRRIETFAFGMGGVHGRSSSDEFDVGPIAYILARDVEGMHDLLIDGAGRELAMKLFRCLQRWLLRECRGCDCHDCESE